MKGKALRIVKVSASGPFLLSLMLSSGDIVYADVRRFLTPEQQDVIKSRKDNFMRLSLERNEVRWECGIRIPEVRILEGCAPTSREALVSTLTSGHVEQLARRIALFNVEYFFPQFTYPITKFELKPGKSRELADYFVLVKGEGIVFQLKEREVEATGDLDKWFQNKVLKRGKEQIRNSLSLLAQYHTIPATNARGRATDLDTRQFKGIRSVICYQTNSEADAHQGFVRWIMSKSAGFIHVFDIGTYEFILSRLVTYAEVLEYLDFRKLIVERWVHERAIPSEVALLGQFFRGDDNARPSEKYKEVVAEIVQDRDEFDMSIFLAEFERDMPDFDPSNIQHEEVLSEFAVLNRTELALARKRLVRSVSYAAGDDDIFTCYRMIASKTGTCFLFVGLGGGQQGGNVDNGFMNLTVGSKYEAKVDRQVSVGVWREGSAFRFRWCLIDGAWFYDPEIERRLSDCNPFKPLSERVVSRYSSRDNPLD